MAENKANLVSIKLSSALINALKDEQYAQRKRGEREQTYAEMLDRAWSAAHTKVSAPETATLPVPERGASSSNSVQDGGKVSVIVSEAELPWVTRLLAILRSGKRIFVKAIAHNLHAFGMSVEAVIDDSSDDADGEFKSFDEALARIDREAKQGAAATRALFAEHRRDRPDHKRNRKQAG